MDRSIDFLNVGFGEATVIRISGEEGSFCLAVDTGDVDPRKNPRRCSFGQYIGEHAIERIDVLILTHFHKDHIGGAYSVMGSVPIGQIIVHVPLPERLLMHEWNDHSTPILASLSLYAGIINKAGELGIPVKMIEEPCTIAKLDMSFSLLLPDRGGLRLLTEELDKLDPAQLEHVEQQDRLARIDRMLNDTAMAVLIRCKGESAALLTSDVGRDFWAPYESELGQVHILQAPHHGDERSISGEWLRAIAPRYVIVSADDEGTYGLPRPAFADCVREHSEAELIYTESLTTTYRIIRMDLKARQLKLIE